MTNGQISVQKLRSPAGESHEHTPQRRPSSRHGNGNSGLNRRSPSLRTHSAKQRRMPSATRSSSQNLSSPSLRTRGGGYRGPELERPPPYDSAMSRRFTPRNSPLKIRSVASTPVLRPKRALRTKGSKLDLIDKSKITSFPTPSREAKPTESSTPADTPADIQLDSTVGTLVGMPQSGPSQAGQPDVDIIEDYIPRPLPDDVRMLDDEPEPIEIADPSWTEFLWRKLRWRWRLQGLLH